MNVLSTTLFVFLFWVITGVYTLITWIHNIIMLLYCDFDPIGKEEIIRILGIFIPFINWITYWTGL